MDQAKAWVETVCQVMDSFPLKGSMDHNADHNTATLQTKKQPADLCQRAEHSNEIFFNDSSMCCKGFSSFALHLLMAKLLTS